MAMALIVLGSCAKKAEKDVENVPQLRGKITVQSLDKDSTELFLQGQALYYIPVTPQTKEFFDTHEGDRFIPENLLTSLPNVRSATIDMNNEFIFKDITSGSYFVYWQLPYEKVMDLRNHSITNHLFPSHVSNLENNVKLICR
jgi:hypothetical protein